MDKEFIPYEEALALKKLGFDEPCFAQYGKTDEGIKMEIWNDENHIKWKTLCGAPTYSQAFKWFRKNFGLYSSINPKKSKKDNHVNGIDWYVNICGGNGKEIGPDGVYSFKKAEVFCLKYLIKLAKNQKK